MQRSTRSLSVIAAAVAAMALAACDRNETAANPTVGQRVDQGVASADRRADQAADATRGAANTVGDRTRDVAITAQVNAKLATDDKLSAMGINVDTVDGRVALNGTAPDAESRERASRLASEIDGVVAVDNRLTVEPRS
jgi:hyperosmotically inducible periplasmic protein